MRVILRDGRVAELRPPELTDSERARLYDLFRRASPDSLYFRFFHVVAEVSDRELDRMMRVQPGESYALVADGGDALLAIGNYARLDEHTAEVAFFVDDRLQQRGVGTLLLEHLAEVAWREGFRQFKAFVLNDNHRMLRVFRSSGFAVTQAWKDGMLELTLPLIQTDRQRSLIAVREKLASAASLKPFFRPRTIAVVGASRDDERLGHQLLRHVIDGGFQGTVYPVNREAASVLSIHAYPRIADIPEPVDLALLVVPASSLLTVINDAIHSGVGGVLITTSGLGETTDGHELEQIIVTKLRQAGIRLIGPNSMGIVNTESALRMNASFAPRLPRAGRLAVASHSGALGVAIMNYADRLGLGISSFVSLGNKSDVSVNDLLQYWEDDPDTDAIMLYMESFGNPAKFSRITRRLARQKPILAVKSVRTASSREIEGLVTDEVDGPVDALFHQSGIIRADTLDELFDVAAILTSQPRPRGPRIGLVTNSAAGTHLAEDAVHTLGLDLVAVTDVGFSGLADAYQEAIASALQRTDLDGLMLLFVPVNSTETEMVLARIEDTLTGYFAQTANPIPVFANVMLADPLGDRFLNAGPRRVPLFPFPETALRAYRRVLDYSRYLAQPIGRILDLSGADSITARDLIRQAMGLQKEVSLAGESLLPVLRAMGINPVLNENLESSLAVSVLPDDLFGPMIVVRSQGIRGRIRLLPLTDQDADRLIPVDLRDTEQTVFRDLVLRVARLVEDCPEILRLELGSVAWQGDTLIVGHGRMVARQPGFPSP
ncbi:GNAT family N-acetyltransferase [Sulfobacillus harzensis]|uniref:GNAT family N-acetyltransferase n=1 Tax=Sulfobacillus harzensis TaxID=2729629 RepID=A0A7Y0L108_9FIRM|nr:GNAT family N-acetyltransferase [Sulfobacillus harzensis]NMP21297.1 GNAT family N-acetyltransferase [Sulfobacillus harzensis]